MTSIYDEIQNDNFYILPGEDYLSVKHTAKLQQMRIFHKEIKSLFHMYVFHIIKKTKYKYIKAYK